MGTSQRRCVFLLLGLKKDGLAYIFLTNCQFIEMCPVPTTWCRCRALKAETEQQRLVFDAFYKVSFKSQEFLVSWNFAKKTRLNVLSVYSWPCQMFAAFLYLFFSYIKNQINKHSKVCKNVFTNVVWTCNFMPNQQTFFVRLIRLK